MWWITVVIVSIANQQMVSALSCYSCDISSSCRQPSDHQLAKCYKYGCAYYKCLNVIYYAPESKITVYEYLGCLHANINACNLTLNMISLAPACNTCNWNYCNSAGTFGKNIHTVVTSALLMILAKFSLS